MSEIFGAPMSTIMTILLVMLFLCFLVVAWVAIRRPVVFKMGIRNIPRRKTQTILNIFGLMLSTLIISAALGTGDTMDYSATNATYKSLGMADELVVYSQEGNGEGSINGAFDDTIPEDTVQLVQDTFAGSDLIDGVAPFLIETVPVVLVNGPAADGDDLLTMAADGKLVQTEPVSFLAGADPAKMEEFGGLKDLDGKTIDFTAIQPGQVVINETMKEKLLAKAGDTVGIAYGNKSYFFTVMAVAEDSPLSGQFDNDTPGMVIPLAQLQALSGKEGLITAVAISNRGGMRDGVELTDQVVDKIKPVLADRDLGIDPLKQDSLDFAKLFASIFTTLFLVFGLFSIAVGILLIILIFSMLAAERRPEMGMARAVGAQRQQLIQQFISEGTGYAIFAGLIGAGLGVGAAVAIALAIRPLLGDFLDITPHVTLRSLVVGYCLGVVITFLAVVVSSYRISRLNIVAAVRDIPDVSQSHRRIRSIIFGVLLILFGVFMTITGLGNDSAFPFYFGMSIIPFAVGMILRYFGVPARPIYSLIGLYLVILWLLPGSVTDDLFGELNGDIEMFFLSGIFMVAGATVLIVQNLDFLLGLLSKVGGLFKSKLPAVRTAVAFPGAAKGRTGMTVAMFSLIVFSLVMFATINENFSNMLLGDEATAGWDVRADQGNANPIGSTADFEALLQSRGIDTTDIEASGATTTNYRAQMRLPGTTNWKQDTIHSMDPGFLDDAKILFQARATGYDSDQAIIDALKTQPNVAIIDASAAGGGDDFGGDDDAFTISDPDGDGPRKALTADDKVFEPVQVEVRGSNGTVQTFTIIGIIDSKVSSMFGFFARQDLITPLFPNPSYTSYYLKITDQGKADAKAKEIETALLVNGVEGTSIRGELEDAQDQNRAFLYIIQGFMGLGLIVGIAAVGVIAFRSVVERRQQIGVLRAIGFQSSMVSLSFLIETAFVVGLGVISGTTLGLVLARNLFADDEFSGGSGDVAFIIPWTIVIVILVVTVIAALLMTWMPARQASRLAPAEALRYE